MFITNLILIRSLMPLLHKEVSDDLRQPGQDLLEALLFSVLLDDVQEPVVKMFFVRCLEHLGNESIVTMVAVEHIYRDSRVQSSHLKVDR